MSAAAPLLARPSASLRIVSEEDDYTRYWFALLRGELLDCDDLSYARRLHTMLVKLRYGEIVLPRRCRTCARYFDQPSTAIRWCSYCSATCRKDFPRKVL